jgi:hypothetical protein
MRVGNACPLAKTSCVGVPAGQVVSGFRLRRRRHERLQEDPTVLHMPLIAVLEVKGRQLRPSKRMVREGDREGRRQ